MKQELSAREREIFVEMPPIKATLTLAMPMVLSQIVGVVYNLADTFFVGRSNEPSMVAAVTLMAPLFLMITALSNLFGVGGASMIARSLGVRDFEKARHVSAFSAWGAAAIALSYGALLLLAEKPLFRLMGVKADTEAFCSSYMLWACVIGGLPTILNTVLANLVRAVGAPKKASFGVCMGCILNIVLDPLLMFVILPAGHEVTGAAMATMLSNLVAAMYFIVYILQHRKDTVLTIDPREIRLQDHIPGDVISIGVPSCLMILLSSVSNAVVSRLISEVDSAALAGMGIAKKINLLGFRVSTGLTQGALPLIAYNHSARDYRRTKSSILCTCGITVGFTVFWMLISFFFGGTFVHLFINNPETVGYGSRFIRIICFAQPLAGVTMCGIIVFQAAAMKGQATFLSVLRKGSLDIPLMFLFNYLWPLYGVAAATPVSEIISCTMTLIFISRFLKKLQAESETA